MSDGQLTDLAVILLAAGMGTRMKSKRQKILHDVGGRPMVMHVVDAARAVAQHRPVLVIGPLGGEKIRALVGSDVDYVVQEEQLGTGHAALITADLLRGRSAQVLVAYGDMPLLRAETMAMLGRRQAAHGAAIVMLTVRGDPESAFGRIVRDKAGEVVEIVEYADAKKRPDAADLLAIREHNVGVYCFDGDWLWDHLPHLPARSARGGRTEYYLTDLVVTAVAQGRRIDALPIDDPDEGLGAGTRAELAAVEKAFRRRANRRALAAGVTLIDPDNTYIDQTVVIGRDTIIWPGTHLQGETVIGEDCQIGPHAVIRNSRLGDRVHVAMAVVDQHEIPDESRVPPFSHLHA